MKLVARGDFQGTNAELLALIAQRITAFKAAKAAHAQTVGVPAPREDPLIEYLTLTDEPYEIEAEPEKPVEPTPEEIAAREAELARAVTLRAETLTQDLLEKLTTATPQQLNDYVNDSVVDLPSARTMFKRILLVLALIAR